MITWGQLLSASSAYTYLEQRTVNNPCGLGNTNREILRLLFLTSSTRIGHSLELFFRVFNLHFICVFSGALVRQRSDVPQAVSVGWQWTKRCPIDSITDRQSLAQARLQLEFGHENRA
jgi:hypothetical protein